MLPSRIITRRLVLHSATNMATPAAGGKRARWVALVCATLAFALLAATALGWKQLQAAYYYHRLMHRPGDVKDDLIGLLALVGRSDDRIVRLLRIADSELDVTYSEPTEVALSLHPGDRHPLVIQIANRAPRPVIVALPHPGSAIISITAAPGSSLPPFTRQVACSYWPMLLDRVFVLNPGDHIDFATFVYYHEIETEAGAALPPDTFPPGQVDVDIGIRLCNSFILEYGLPGSYAPLGDYVVPGRQYPPRFWRRYHVFMSAPSK
jgi:hypothetical protein